MIAIWIVCACAAAVWAARCPPAEVRARRRVLIAAALFGPAILLVWLGLRVAAALVSNQYDQFLLAVDGAYGFQASFVLGRWFWRWPPAAVVCRAAYDGLHIAILILLLPQAWKDPKWSFARALAANFLIAYALYFVLPAAGPVYAFAGQFPDRSPEVLTPAWMRLRALPNAMPSVHFSTALLLFWNARVFRHGRAVFGLYMALVGLATLGTGEHYLVDLVVAVPYTALVQSLGRRRISYSAAGLVLTWIALLRLR